MSLADGCCTVFEALAALTGLKLEAVEERAELSSARTGRRHRYTGRLAALSLLASELGRIRADPLAALHRVLPRRIPRGRRGAHQRRRLGVYGRVDRGLSRGDHRSFWLGTAFLPRAREAVPKTD